MCVKIQISTHRVTNLREAQGLEEARAAIRM
jgi:hypothetical protein